MIRLLLFIFTIICSCEINNPSSSINNVNILNLSELTRDGEYALLDVRTNEERLNGYIANSTHIDYYDEAFYNKINLLDRNKPIYIYCKVGGRSSKAATKIINAGFKKVFNLEGGFLKWSSNNLPIELAKNLNEEITQEYNKLSLDSAITSNENLLLYISTKWCVPCKRMNPVVDSLSNNFANDVKILKLDLDRNMFLNELYDIKSIPLFVLYKNNKKVWFKNGIIAYSELATKL